MRVVFFGLPLAGLAIARAGHEVVLAGICRKQAPGTRRLRHIVGDDRVLMRPDVDDPSLLARVRALAPDLFVSWFWTTRLPTSLVAAARQGGFGVHPSLLPRWRGPDPYFWAIDAGDAVTGVTAHRLDAEYDTGAVLGQRVLAIDPRWDSWGLARALDRSSLELLVETVYAFSRGTPPRETAQDAATVTEAPAPDDSLLELDFRRPAADIVRRIRAAAPYPGAWTFVGDDTALVVTRAETVPRLPGLLPGEAMTRGGRAVVAAADAGVALLQGRLVLDDDTEKPVDAGEIVALLGTAGSGGRGTPSAEDSG
ncbi:MAG: formyltransferase family protein [Polyangiales bacterium]